MAILFPVKREMAILFFVKRDLDPPLPPSVEHDVPQQEPGMGFFSVIMMKFVMYLPIIDQIPYKNRVSNATTTRSTHGAVNGVNHCIKLERSRNLLTGFKGCLENNHP